MLFRIYKPGQGKYSRAVGLVCLGGLALFGCYSLYESLLIGFWKKSLWMIPGIDQEVTPALLVVLGAALLCAAVLYALNNRRKVVDFLIETEGELRKVAWPSRDEVVGSSIVVVVTVVLMGLVIFFSDIIIKTLLHDFIYGRLH